MRKRLLLTRLLTRALETPFFNLTAISDKSETDLKNGLRLTAFVSVLFFPLLFITSKKSSFLFLFFFSTCSVSRKIINNSARLSKNWDLRWLKTYFWGTRFQRNVNFMIHLTRLGDFNRIHCINSQFTFLKLNSQARINF